MNIQEVPKKVEQLRSKHLGLQAGKMEDKEVLVDKNNLQNNNFESTAESLLMFDTKTTVYSKLSATESLDNSAHFESFRLNKQEARLV